MKVDPEGPALADALAGAGAGRWPHPPRTAPRSPAAPTSCASIAPPSGWPILGDPIYGTAPRFGGPGLHLHARSVTVPLYPKKPPITVEAPVPEHMRERVKACGVIPDGEADPGSLPK